VSKKLNPKVLAFNVVAAFFILAVAANEGRKLLFPPQLAACSTRVTKTVTLGLSHNGRLLQAVDFQAIANGQDVGLLDNLSIVPARNAPSPVVMDVFLKAGTAQQRYQSTDGGGISMPWTPRSLHPDLTAACLSYSVFFPETFVFSDAGTLPGLRGASKAAGVMSDEKHTTHIVWDSRGALRHHVQGGDNEITHNVMIAEARPIPVAKGRWVKIDHELKLNDRGVRNGRSRLWVDGRFVSEREGLLIRYNQDHVITGADVDIYFGGQGEDAARGRAPIDQRILLTPIKIGWE
jgi:hypothetical protein